MAPKIWVNIERFDQGYRNGFGTRDEGDPCSVLTSFVGGEIVLCVLTVAGSGGVVDPVGLSRL
jgi:hypothetical protein